MAAGRAGRAGVAAGGVLLLALAASGGAAAEDHALRLFGWGADRADRVEIALRRGAVIDPAGDVTVEFWIRPEPGNASGPCREGPDGWTAGNVILDRDVFGLGDRGDWGVSLAGGVIAFGVARGAEAAGLCGATRLGPGWHHVAVTREGRTGRLAIFLDGRLDAAGPGPRGDIRYRLGRPTDWPADPFLVIGAEKHDYDRSAYPSFAGLIDDLRISGAVRYRADFAPPAGPHPDDAATLGLWRFDEGAGTVAADVATRPGRRSPGELRRGGPRQGPHWSADTPFAGAPAPVSLDAPLDGAAAVPRRPTFAWTPAEGAARYELELAAGGGPFRRLYRGAAPVFRPARALAADAPHRWRVRSLDAAGRPSRWSTVWTFRTGP